MTTGKKIIFYVVFAMFALSTILMATMPVWSIHTTTIKCVDDLGNKLDSHKFTSNVFTKKSKTDSYLDDLAFEGYLMAGFKDKDGNYLKEPNYDSNKIYPYFIEIASSNMPIINITTKDHAPILDKENYVESKIEVMNADDETHNFTGEDAKSAGIRLRGNSTSHTEKPPYRIKFDSRTNLLGLNDGNKIKSWVLLAEYFDHSLSRNYLSFSLGHKLGFDYCSDFCYVEVFLNNRYIGVFLLAEHQQVDKYRVDIEEYDEENPQTPENIGYFIENDYFRYYEEEYYTGARVNGETRPEYHWVVKSDIYNEEQLAYIDRYMQDVYDAIYGSRTQSVVENLVDIDSFVNMTILQLINLDSDCDSSFYAYKDVGGKLVFTAPWDDDMAYGNLQHFKQTRNLQHINHLLRMLMQEEWFQNKVKTRYAELNSATLKTEIIDMLQSISEDYEREFDRNQNRYDFYGTKNYKHLTSDVLDFENQKDASVYLQNWISRRFDKLDAYVNSL